MLQGAATEWLANTLAGAQAEHDAYSATGLAELHANAKQPWRVVATEAWLTLGQHVRDEFGDWWIRSLPDDDDTYGYAQIEIASASDKAPERHIWLNEFLRDFQPVVQG